MPRTLHKSLDEIPEASRADALELKDGSFVVFQETDKSEDIAKLSTTNKAIRQERDDAIRQAKEAAEKLAETQRQLEAKIAATGDTDKTMTATLEKWNREKAEEIARVKAEMEAQYRPVVEKVTVYELDNVLGAAFIEAGGREERRARAIAQAKLDGWQLVDGQAVRKKGEQIESATPNDYFGKDFREEIPEFYKGTQASGGGAAGAQSGAGHASNNSKPPTQWSSDERRAFIEQNGADAYRGLLDNQIRGAVSKAA